MTTDAGRSHLAKLLERLEESTQECRARFRRDLNSGVTVHRLPLEVLLIIIELATAAEVSLPASDDKLPKSKLPTSRLHALTSKSLVCSYWADAIWNEPTLWAVLDAEHNILKYLDRSGSAPISTHKTLTFREADKDARKALEGLVSRSDQWRSMSLAVDVKLRDACKLKDGKALQLKEFRLQLVSTQGLEPVDIDVFNGEMPKLERLALGNGIRVSLGASGFSNLREVDLKWVVYSASDVLGMMNNNPNLSRLYIGDVLDTPPEIPQQAPIVHPSLKDIQLGGGAASCILPFLTAPNCELMEVGFLLNDEDVPTAMPAIVEFFVRQMASWPEKPRIVWRVELPNEGGLVFLKCGAGLRSGIRGECQMEVILTADWSRGGEWVDTVVEGLKTLGDDMFVELLFDWAGAAENRYYLEPQLRSSLMKLPARLITVYAHLPREVCDYVRSPSSGRMGEDPVSGEERRLPEEQSIELCSHVSLEDLHRLGSSIVARARPPSERLMIGLPPWKPGQDIIGYYLAPRVWYSASSIGATDCGCDDHHGSEVGDSDPEGDTDSYTSGLGMAHLYDTDSIASPVWDN